MKHACIKPVCSNTYEDNEPDAYYCPSCFEEKKALAEKVDATITSRPRKETKSNIQLLEEHGKMPMGKGVQMFMRKSS